MGRVSRLHNDTYQKIAKEFPEFTLRENIRPDWLVSSNLSRLEIDIYIEEIKTAIEIQGAQHYEYTPYFHKTYQDFKDQQERDTEKRDLCYGNKIKLVEIACYSDLKDFIDSLKAVHIPSDMKFFYSKPSKSKMRSKEYRRKSKERKANLIRLRAERIDANNRKPSFGSKVQRKYARNVLECCQNIDDPNSWFIWGGSDPHMVIYDGEFYSCDCIRFEQTSKICTHIIKVLLEENNFQKYNDIYVQTGDLICVE